MVDVTAGQDGASRLQIPSFDEIKDILKRGDLTLAFGVLTIHVVLILPLPAMVLDLFLAVSITLSVLILMTSLFIQAPLEFSAFPTVLLISTMLRLSLNMASTRLILSHGHEGSAAAGKAVHRDGDERNQKKENEQSCAGGRQHENQSPAHGVVSLTT